MDLLALYMDSEEKYRLAKWSVVCRPKDQEGLEIHDT
jgi:hypothetical protein